MFCIECGKNIEAAAKFCAGCGTKQNTQLETASEKTIAIKDTLDLVIPPTNKDYSNSGYKYGYWFSEQSTTTKLVIIGVVLYIVVMIASVVLSPNKSLRNESIEQASNITLNKEGNDSPINESGSIIISAVNKETTGGGEYCRVHYEIENKTGVNFTELGFDTTAKDENGNILVKAPSPEFRQALPNSKVGSTIGGSLLSVKCDRIGILDLSLRWVEIDGTVLRGNPKRLAAFGKIIKSTPNGVVQISAQGGQVSELVTNNNEPKGNLLEKAINPFNGNRAMWEKFADAGGLNSESNYYGLSIKNATVEFEDNNSFKAVTLILGSETAPTNIRKSLSKVCRLTDSDWKFENGARTSGEATRNGVTCNYLKGGNVMQVIIEKTEK